jgi:hypothetical protein
MPAGVTQTAAPLASRDCYDTDRRLSKIQTPSKFKKPTDDFITETSINISGVTHCGASRCPTFLKSLLGMICSHQFS